MENASIKTSRYQKLPDVKLKNYWKKQRRGYTERNEMKNPVYYQLWLKDNFAGFKRVVTEFLPPGANRWQLESIPHDADATQKLRKPAMGIATYGREKIISESKQRRVTNPKSKSQDGPTPVPSRGGIAD